MINFLALGCAFSSSAFALLTYAITSLGDAISFQVIFNGFQLIGLMPLQNLSEIIAEYSIFGWPCSIIQTIYIRQYIDWRLCFMVGITGIIGNISGLELLMKLQGLWLKRCIGYVILMTYIISIILPKMKKLYTNNNIHTTITQEINSSHKEDDDILYKPTTLLSYIGVIIAALSCGFMHGLFGIGGPPLMIWVIITNINRNQFRASMSCSAAMFIHPVTSYYLVIYKKQLNITNNYGQYIAIFIGGMIGLLMGNILAKRINQFKFKQIIQLLLIIGATMLGLYGLKYSNFMIPLIICFVIIIFCCYRYKQKISNVDTEKKELDKNTRNSDYGTISISTKKNSDTNGVNGDDILI